MEQSGDYVYVRYYSEGYWHSVVVSKDGVVVDSKTYQHELKTQIADSGTSRRDGFKIVWERHKAVSDQPPRRLSGKSQGDAPISPAANKNNISSFGDLSSGDSKKSGRGSVSGLHDDKNLVVVHNVSPQKLRDAAKLGAMPAPSLAVIRDLRNDLEQYGGTNDVLLIYGNAKEGIYHIASKHGSNVLFHVLDALADGKILNLCRETKRCIFKKTDLPQFFP